VGLVIFLAERVVRSRMSGLAYQKVRTH
jgi:hypothetical protein